MRDQTLASEPLRPRVDAVDAVRGIVMILMALDHTRDYFGARVDPTNVATTTLALFFTRWITHVCAPTFFLLTGTGAGLARRRRTTGELSRFLFTRGLWLVVLEVVVVRFGLQLNMDYRVTMLLVLWALGWSMVALSALVWLPNALIAAVGIAMISGHDLFDGVRPTGPLGVILHGPGFLVRTPSHVVFAGYPLIPWIGVTAAGYALASIYSWDTERRRAFLLRFGIGLACAFVLLRAVNVYGDPSPWSVQPTVAKTIVSFLDATKYPPSLLFLLMTLAVTMLALRAFDGRMPRPYAPALTFGRVPLFYFVLHLPLIHLFAVAVASMRYGTAHWLFESPTLDRYPFTLPPGWGYSLAVVYAAWALVVLTMYPLCVWYAGVKARSRSPVLRYL
jgi:uncharacterized membrane protein